MSSSTTKNIEKARSSREEKSFVWEDEEVELLLSSTLDYKKKKTSEGIDWESVKSKYADILEIYCENRPATASEGGGSRESSQKEVPRSCG